MNQHARMYKQGWSHGLLLLTYQAPLFFTADAHRLEPSFLYSDKAHRARMTSLDELPMEELCSLEGRLLGTRTNLWSWSVVLPASFMSGNLFLCEQIRGEITRTREQLYGALKLEKLNVRNPSGGNIIFTCFLHLTKVHDARVPPCPAWLPPRIRTLPPFLSSCCISRIYHLSREMPRETTACCV